MPEPGTFPWGPSPGTFLPFGMGLSKAGNKRSLIAAAGSKRSICWLQPPGEAGRGPGRAGGDPALGAAVAGVLWDADGREGVRGAGQAASPLLVPSEGVA